MATVSKVEIDFDFGKALEGKTKELMRLQVLAGIPGASPSRPLEPGEKRAPPNSLIAYVQEFGDEEKHIPPRPFLLPGIANAKPQIVAELAAAGIVAMSGGSRDQIKACFDAAGLFAQASIKNALLNGVFAPLSPRTLQARADRRNGKGKLSQAETSKAARRELKSRAAGNAATTDARPLYDTHSLFNSITYVVQDKAKG